jgi:hypothetical protein
MAKKDDSVQAELAQLRAQLEAAKSSGQANTGSDTPKSPDEGAAASASASGAGIRSEAEAAGREVAADLSAQFKEFTDGLNRELKDANPITLLAVFAVGIFIGRLMPR